MQVLQVGVVLDVFIANVEARVAFSFAFLEDNHFGFLRILSLASRSCSKRIRCSSSFEDP